MTKIRPVLLWLLLVSPLFDFGQATNELDPASAPLPSGPAVGHVTNKIRTDRQPVFTVHRLAGQVDPAKKWPSERLIKGRPASLPCPIQPQQPRRLY